MIKTLKKRFWDWPDGWVWRVTGERTKQSRRDRFDLFMRLMKPTARDRLLDVGVGLGEGRTMNFFEEWYPWRTQLTALAVEDSPGFRVRYPDIAFVVGDGRRMDFPDRTFDVCFSNAVVEHVGSLDRQRSFIQESCRVGKSVFFSTPNRWFPIELHTLVPFAHWLPIDLRNTIYRVLGRDYWANEDTLRLMTLSEIRRCVPKGWSMEVHRQRVFGWTINFNVILRRD